MQRETTPRIITPAIKNLCNDIVMNSTPIKVPVIPDAGALPQECFLNVQSVVSNKGGLCINGWIIWQWANILIEAEAHAIWQNPAGTLIDVTPHNLGEREILFLPDESILYEGHQIPSKRKALTQSAFVNELISIMDTFDRLQTYAMPIELIQRNQEIRAILNTPVKRNDKCPCGSGLKYKKCCGRYE